VRDAVDGLLVAPREAEVEEALRRLLDEPEVAERLGFSARRRYLDTFSIDPFASRFEVLLSDVGVAGPEVTSVVPGTVLHPREVYCWDVPAEAVATIHLRALEHSHVEVDGTPVLSLTANRVHRVRITESPATLAVTVLSGAVLYEGTTLTANRAS
jgi:hypothetical protein